MIYEVHFLLEVLGAQVALERSLAGVSAEVSSQVRTDRKRLAAIATNILVACANVSRAAHSIPIGFSEQGTPSRLSYECVVYWLITRSSSGGACKRNQN